MHVRFHRALLACAQPVPSVRMPARRASSRPLVIAGVYLMHVCVLDAMYVCFQCALLVCALFSRRACSHSRPPYIIALTLYRKDIFYACTSMCARRYVCTLPPCFACSCHVCPILELACSPAVHERTLTRCSMWLHPCLYVVTYLHASRRPNIYCSFSYTVGHVCSTLVGIMCMLPSCSAWSCPLRVADHHRTPDLCSSASVVLPSC